jgi:non-heme chloroperoxidase
MDNRIDRRRLIGHAAAALLVSNSRLTAQPTEATGIPREAVGIHRAPTFIVAKDGTRLFVQDWGSGRPIVFLSAWTFNSNVWGSHIAALNARGFRCIAPDRRGHGRSDVTCMGYDPDTLAQDAAAVIDGLDLKDVVLVSHSMGLLEAAKYSAGRGSHRIARLVLAASTSPCLTQAPDNPEGFPSAAIQAQENQIAKDFPKWIDENEAPFFTSDTPPATRTWIKTMMLSVPLPVALACRRAGAAADLRADLAKITCPTLLLHGDKDSSAPLAYTAARTSRLIPNSKLIVYPDAPHALILTHRDRFLSDLLAFAE